VIIQSNQDNSKLKGDKNSLRDMYYSSYLTRIYINLLYIIYTSRIWGNKKKFELSSFSTYQGLIYRDSTVNNY